MKVLQVGINFACALDEYEEFCKRHEVVHMESQQRTRSEVIAEIEKTVKSRGPFDAW